MCLPGELQQVLLNVIVNAAQSIGEAVVDTNGKGTIRIETKRQDGCVEIRIRDTGTGIPEEHQPRIFDPFFTTKDVGHGTGQGLAIAHSVIVQQHNGRIWFESAVGKGTEFFIQLPVNGVGEAASEKHEANLVR
jgi:signal transduction histidine kinase